MAIANYYIDPSIAANSGSGTIGDPYGDVQHALDSISQGADGDQINIKTGTDEVLAGSLSLASYGSPASDKPLIFRGYATAANDGGQGAIDCNGSSLFASTSYDYIILWDLEIHSGPAGNMIDLDDYCTIIQCAVHNVNGRGIVLNAYAQVLGCTIYDCATNGLRMTESGVAAFNYFYNGATYDFASAITLVGAPNVFFNLFKLDGASNGIVTTGGGNGLIMNNTVYAHAGSGSGILAGAADDMWSMLNNYIEGFSGVGGKGISLNSSAHLRLLHNNFYFNNATNEDFSGVIASESGNMALSASGLKDPSNDDFRPKGNLSAGAWPAALPTVNLPNYTTIGALMRKERRRLPGLFNPGA